MTMHTGSFMKQAMNKDKKHLRQSLLFLIMADQNLMKMFQEREENKKNGKSKMPSM